LPNYEFVNSHIKYAAGFAWINNCTDVNAREKKYTAMHANKIKVAIVCAFTDASSAISY